MGGGYLQLISNNNANDFLSNNPQISYFKSVYRKYTPFAIESIMIDNTTAALSDNETTISVQIPRDADLVTGMYFTFKLPAIYSGKYSDNENTYRFKWIENIGANIIKEATLSIGGVIIDRLYSEWLDVYSELMLTSDEKAILNKLSGNVNEVHSPEKSLGYNGNYPHICGPIAEQHLRNDSQGFNILTFSESNVDTSIPSIPEMDIKVPLPFWFHGKTGLALPLIALQYDPVVLNITLRKIYDLYTVIDPVPGKESFNKRIKANSSREDLSLSHFVKNTSYSNNSLSIHSKVEVVYGFLGENERKRFAVNEHEYLITKLHKSNTKDLDSGMSDFNIPIRGSSPVKYIVVIPKRKDTENLNNWNNYTNWLSKVPPYSPEYLYEDQYYDTVSTPKFPFYTKGYSPTTDFIPSNLENNIIESFSIKFNGNDRFKPQTKNYFEYQQPLQHFKRNPKRGIYAYSFSLDPHSDSPTGACDLSTINCELEGTLNLPDITNYKVKIDVYIVSYNILKIVSGQGGLMYV
jgi:hypothetical protein